MSSSNFQSLTSVSLSGNVEKAHLPGLAKPIEPIKVKHRFGGYTKDKNTGLYKYPEKIANLIIFDYQGDGEGLRFNPLDGGNKDFKYRELKPGFSKSNREYKGFDPAFSFSLSGKTWKPYRYHDVQKYAVGKWALKTEGEKDCESVRVNAGLVTISFAGGMWSQDKVNEQCQMLKDAGLALLVYWGDDDKEGIYKANKVKYGCASVGLPCVVLDARKFFPQLPEWQLDKDGDLNGSGWGAADYFEHNNITPDEFIAIIEEQITEAAKQPLEPVAYPVKPGCKGNKKSSGSSSTSSKKSSNGDRTPEEKQARKNRIANGNHLLRDFISDRAWTALVNGSPSGSRHEDYPHLCWELWESYNYLLALGIETEDKPEQLLNEWFKNSGLSSADGSYDKAQDCFNDNTARLPNDSKKKTIENLLADKDVETEAKRIIDVEIKPVEPFKFLLLADRNDPLVKANPNAHWNRGSSSLALAQTESEMPIVFCYGEDNGKLLAKHGYLVGLIPDEKPSAVNLKYWGGFTKPDWEGVTEETKVKYKSEVKPGIRDFLGYKQKTGKFSDQGRDILVVLNGKKPGLLDYIKLLQKLDSTKNNVYVVDHQFPSVVESSYGIDSFNEAYAKAIPFDNWFTRKMSSPLQAPDVVIDSSEKYFPKEVIAIPQDKKFVAYTGIHGSGKSIQIAKQAEKNKKEGILTVILYKTIILKEQGKAKMGLPTIEDVVEAGKLSGDLAILSCMDSLDKVARVLYSLGYLNPDSPLFGKYEVDIDEVTETLTHLALGTGTYLADYRPAASKAFSRLVHNARRTSIFDADISPVFIDYLYELTKCKPFIIQHGRKAHNENIIIWGQNSPDMMLNLGLIKSLKQHPDKAFMVQSSSTKYDTKWNPDVISQFVAKHDSRTINKIDHEAVTDSKNENFELLSKRFDDGTTKLDLQMAKYSQEKQLVVINVASIGTSIESPFEKNFIVAPAIHSPWAAVQNLRRCRLDREIHLWVQEINTGYNIYNSTDAEEIKNYLHKQDDCVRLDFLARGDEIDDVPYDAIFEDFQCRLAALLNWFNKHFGKAVKALLTNKWESNLIDSSDYIKGELDKSEVDDYGVNSLALKIEVDTIRDNKILTKHQAVVDAYRLKDCEYSTLKAKHEKLTEAEQNSITLYEFEHEYQGCIPCTAENVRDYLEGKPYKLQQMYYYLNPDKARFKAALTVEKTTENGRRDRVDQLRKTAKLEGITALHNLNFDQFFHEFYTIKDVTPFEGIRKIEDGNFNWISSTVKATTENGETYTRCNLDFKNQSWTSLLQLFDSMGNKCSNVFGFSPVRAKSGKISRYPTIKAFLSNYFIELKYDEETKSHWFRLEDDRDLYFLVLDKRHEDIENSDLVIGIGEGHHKPVTATGKHIKAAYQYQVKNQTATESLLELIAKSKTKGLPTEHKPLFSTPTGIQLELATNATKEELEALESAKQAILPEEEKQPIIGDYAFANGMIVKLISQTKLGIGNHKADGYLVEAVKNKRQSKVETEKLKPASVEVLADWINAKLAQHPDDQGKFLENIRTYLPEKYELVLKKILVAV